MATLGIGSTNPSALRSVLNTVSKAATSASALFDAGTNSIGMLDALVSKASTQQKLKYRAQQRDFVKDLVRQSAHTQSLADKQVKDFCDEAPENKELFDLHYSEYAALFAEELGLTESK